jgi:microcompartment protein CcmL/EutN
MYKSCVFNNLKRLEAQFTSGVIPQLVDSVNYVIDQQSRLTSEVLASVSATVRNQIQEQIRQQLMQEMSQQIRAEVQAEIERIKTKDHL